jgi:holo-ACP synthase/triphosphoribosyl-dephospho-CoA synthase
MEETRDRQASLEDVLAARDGRAEAQAELRQRYGLPVVSMTVNMAGTAKYSDDTVSLLYEALIVLRGRLRAAGLAPREERLLHAAGGPAAILAVAGDPAALKRLGVGVEEELPGGRLVDIDVFAADGRQIGRADLGLPPRACLLCGGPAAVCVRSAAHDKGEVLAAMRRLILCHKAGVTRRWPPAAETAATAALEAMLMETACTPAPGLVDRANSGAHGDMDYFTFLRSSGALAPYLLRCALAGAGHEGRPSGLLPVLRAIGGEGERAMFAATGGVNTQKGLLFLLGVLAAAAALAARSDRKPAAGDIASLAGAVCEGIVERELAALKEKAATGKLTAGERLYLEHGMTGIRGEMAAGLPAVTKTGLPVYRAALADGLPLNDALVQALLALMTVAEDTTVVNRHGPGALAAVRRGAAAVLAAGGMRTEQGRRAVEELDRDFVRRNISPGGAADLLAATHFLHTVEARLGG